MLTENNFSRIGTAGIGNTRSSLAHCLAYFNDRIYLGVTHHLGEGPQDQARILCYDPDVKKWEQVHISPLVEADAQAIPQDTLRPKLKDMIKHKFTGQKVPKYRGYRSMTVFQGKSDPHPVLYVTTICHWGAQLLRSEDGKTFTAVSKPGLGNHHILSFRSLTDFQGKLFTASTGLVKDGVMDRNFSGIPVIYVSEDPASDIWEPAMEEGFGDPNNNSISCIRAFNNFLYASVGNPERGFQLWKTDAVGKPPYQWHPIFLDGAYKYNLNETAPTMIEFNGALYIGGGLPGLGYDTANDVGPASAELIRVYPDDNWDLVVGRPRFTPDGMKVPFAARGPGFDNNYNSIIWSMAVHDGCLYAGTLHWITLALVFRGRKPVGGFQLWASQDGDNWEPVTLDGFGDPLDVGLRSMLSTPVGLVIGTHNHQGIVNVIQQRLNSPQTDEFGAGGCKVWLGSKSV